MAAAQDFDFELGQDLVIPEQHQQPNDQQPHDQPLAGEADSASDLARRDLVAGVRARNSILLGRINETFHEQSRCACSTDDLRTRTDRLYLDTLNTWRQSLGTVSGSESNGQLVIPRDDQRDLQKICDTSKQLFARALDAPAQQLSFNRVRKTESGLDRSYYVFTTPPNGSQPIQQQRVIESVRQPTLAEYVAVFKQIKGFSPVLWRAFMQHCEGTPAASSGGKLGAGGCSSVKLGFEMCRSNRQPKFVALRQQTPEIVDAGHIKPVMRPEVEHGDASFLIGSSDYFPLVESAQRQRNVQEAQHTVCAQLNLDNPQNSFKADFQAKPSYYTINALGYSSMQDIINECSMGCSALTARIKTAELKPFVTKLVELLAHDDRNTFDGRNSTLEQNRFAAAKFVAYMRTTGVDRASRALLALAAQTAKAVLTLHQSGRTHGDIKPANLLLVPDSSTASSDKLLLQLADLDSMSTLASQARVFSPLFSAPTALGESREAIENDRHALGKTLEKLGDAVEALNTFRRELFPEAPTDLRHKVFGAKMPVSVLKSLDDWSAAAQRLKALGGSMQAGFISTQCKVIVENYAKIIVHKHKLAKANTERRNANVPTRTERHEAAKLSTTLQNIADTLKLQHSSLSSLESIILNPEPLSRHNAAKIYHMLGISSARGQCFMEDLIRIGGELAGQLYQGNQIRPDELEARLKFLKPKDVAAPLENAVNVIESLNHTLFAQYNGDAAAGARVEPTIGDFNHLGLLSLSAAAADRDASLGQSFRELATTPELKQAFQAIFRETLKETPLVQGRTLAKQYLPGDVDLRDGNVLDSNERKIYKRLFNKKPSVTWYSLREDAGEWMHAKAVVKHYIAKVQTGAHKTGQVLARLGLHAPQSSGAAESAGLDSAVAR